MYEGTAEIRKAELNEWDHKLWHLLDCGECDLCEGEEDIENLREMIQQYMEE